MLMPTIMTNAQGVPEEYLNKTEAAAFLGVSFPTFEKNYEGLLQAYKSPRRKKVRLFKVEDLTKLNVVRPIEDEEK